jgi:hypothetical protein
MADDVSPAARKYSICSGEGFRVDREQASDSPARHAQSTTILEKYGRVINVIVVAVKSGGLIKYKKTGGD